MLVPVVGQLFPRAPALASQAVGRIKPHLTRVNAAILIVPFFIYFLCVEYGRHHFYRDPGSRFFDRTRAFNKWYSNVRLEEAAALVQIYNRTNAPEFKRQASTDPPFMCVGMNTIVRPSDLVYARDTLASLLAGLNQKERDMLYVMPLIGHINATDHPMYDEPWLSHVADRVLTYQTSETLSKPTYNRIEELELERKKTGQLDREKQLTDYTHLLRACAATGATYITMVEDDVVAVDGWFHRTREALEALDKKAGPEGWFYLRLFYSENYLGFNREDVLWYCSYIALYAIITLSVFKIVMNYVRQHRRGTIIAQKSGPTLLMATCISYWLAVQFVFTSGKIALLGNRHGLIYMPMHGCCAQGITYPNSKVAPLTAWFEKNRVGFVDTLAERLADEKPDGYDVGGRWAVSPSLMQHVGAESTKGDELLAGTLWNFEFETYKKEQLRKAHEDVSKQMGDFSRQ